MQPNSLFRQSQSSDASSSTSLSLPSVSFVCPTAPLAMCLCAPVFDFCLLWTNRTSLCHVTAVSLFGAVLPCPVLLVAVQKVLTALQWRSWRGVPVSRDEWIAFSWVMCALMGVRGLEDGSVVTWGLYSLGLVYWLLSPPFSLSIEFVLGRFFVCPSVVCPLKPRGFLCLCACVPPVFFVLVAGARRVLDPCLFGCSSSSPRLQRGTCRILHRHAVSVTSLCVSGLESEAVKYDEAMKSMWFSQNIDSGVSILSAQTDLQHCVSTLVVICTRSG